MPTLINKRMFLALCALFIVLACKQQPLQATRGDEILLQMENNSPENNSSQKPVATDSEEDSEESEQDIREEDVDNNQDTSCGTIFCSFFKKCCKISSSLARKSIPVGFGSAQRN